MPFLRLGSINNWRGKSANCSDDVASAASDLTPRGSEDISIYAVANLEEARRVATLHAVTQRVSPGSIDGVLLPDSVMADMPIRAVPDDRLPAALRELHHEIEGLNSESARKSLAERALGHGETIAFRLTQSEVVERACSLTELKEAEGSISDRWKERLARKRAEGQV